MFHYPFSPSELSKTAELWWDLFGFYLAVAFIIGAAVYAGLVLIPFYYAKIKGGGADEIKPGVIPPERGRQLFVAAVVLVILGSFLAVFVESYISVNKLNEPLEEFAFIDEVRNAESITEIDVEGALVVEVVGFQWGWTFRYPNGIETDILYMPQDTLVVFRVVSEDVFHTFTIPDLRVKIDAIPGQVNVFWTYPETPGTFRVQCYELCGVGHAEMITKAIVLPQDLFEFWYNSLGEAEVELELSG